MSAAAPASPSRYREIQQHHHQQQQQAAAATASSGSNSNCSISCSQKAIVSAPSHIIAKQSTCFKPVARQLCTPAAVRAWQQREQSSGFKPVCSGSRHNTISTGGTPTFIGGGLSRYLGVANREPKIGAPGSFSLDPNKMSPRESKGGSTFYVRCRC